jgi:16S rRNA (guanine527-N7)-methyltransferase
MQPARIAELLAPFMANDQRLTTNDLEHISTYIDLLLRWNARMNLTAIRDPEEIVTRHFGESLFAARHLFPRDAHLTATWKSGPSAPRPEPSNSPVIPSEDFAPASRSEATVEGPCVSHPRLADLGSGAGFPGIPIKLYAPEISLTLIESNHKKSTFLREVTRALILTDINILTARAESLDAKLHHSFDVVTLRAVERFDQILPIAATLLARNACLALLIGTSQLDHARKTLPALSWREPIAVPQSQSRILLVGDRSA